MHRLLPTISKCFRTDTKKDSSGDVVVVSFVIGSVTSLLSAFDRKKFDKVGAYRSK